MNINGAPNVVSSLMHEYGEATHTALNRYLPRKEPGRFLYDLVADYPRRGGKMMRPSLCIAAARIFGAQIEDALETAVAIELLHNALLIHDDIEDGSEKRRGEPTLHMLHGVPLAINAGDALTLMALEPLLHNRYTLGEQLALRIIEETQRMARACAEGQAMELGWCRYNVLDIGDADYLDMVLKKTCWLATIYPLRVGALIGSRGSVDLEPFVRFGFFLGAAFQIQDDLLNLVADERYGKELNGDLCEGKRTLMLIDAFRRSTDEERDCATRILALPRERRTTEDVCWLRTLIHKYESVEYARRIANELAGAALHEFSLLSAELRDSREKAFLERMPSWVIERQ